MTRKVRAVIVGINEYQDPRYLEKKLRFARADADEIARVISQSNAFQVEKLELYPNQFATQERVWRGLNSVFPSNLNFDSNSIALFYFAGHGMKDPIEGERILLGCYDVDVANPMKGGIPFSSIYNLLLRSGAGCSIAIIDACFSGAVMDLKRVEHETPVEQARRAIGALQGADDKTIAIFAACRADQAAREEEERGHGVYTDELLRGWRDGKARDENGCVDLSGLATYLGRRFAEDEQAPRSTLLSGRPIVLWRHEPPAQGVPLTSPEPLKRPRRLVDVGDRLELQMAPLVEVKTWKERLRGLAIPIICAVVGLLLCALSTVFVEPIRLGFLAVVFGLSIVLAISSFGVHRLLGTILVPVQLALLAGFAYQYFHWGAGIAPVSAVLVFLAGFVWLFWLLLCTEIGLVVVFVLLSLMS
jgi:caspase domain-containing protein